jgi:hypothetical protein
VSPPGKPGVNPLFHVAIQLHGLAASVKKSLKMLGFIWDDFVPVLCGTNTKFGTKKII